MDLTAPGEIPGISTQLPAGSDGFDREAETTYQEGRGEVLEGSERFHGIAFLVPSVFLWILTLPPKMTG